MTDIEIAEKITPKKIEEVANELGLKASDLICYGPHKAKVIKKISPKKNSKLILVTAMTPTSSGIGKTTVSIGLADALRKQKCKTCLALREPSLGPVFGIKGGATGGGYSQVIPMADINLHFNGDFHAITSANNLLCSMIDNHIFHGNELGIDTKQILFHRCLDINDRALREITVSDSKGMVSRKDSLTITAASEIMAIMCLSENLSDLKTRLENIIVAFTKKGKPIYCKDLKCADAMAILLKDALNPNLVQTLEGTPALVHLGPFANIAHGCNSITATKLSMTLADYTITEAGFGSDLGAEKFFDIKCRTGELNPNAVVLVVTIPALKLHGGVDKNNLKAKNVDAVKEGINNMLKHVDIIKTVFEKPIVVAINKFPNDKPEEIEVVNEALDWLHINHTIVDAHSKGSEGAMELAKIIKKLCKEENTPINFAYDIHQDIKGKIEAIATRVYYASGVKFTKTALKKLKTIDNLNLNNLPVVIAKTQYSFSDNPKLLGAPTGHIITISDLELKTGAGFVVAIAGNMMLMPGLSKEPAGAKMTISDNGKIKGLF